MRSKLAEEAQKDLIKSAKKLTPAQRLAAFAEHCRLSFKFHEAGKAFRKRKKTRPTS
jgi:hypothetical protein